MHVSEYVHQIARASKARKLIVGHDKLHFVKNAKK